MLRVEMIGMQVRDENIGDFRYVYARNRDRFEGVFAAVDEIPSVENRARRSPRVEIEAIFESGLQFGRVIARARAQK